MNLTFLGATHEVTGSYTLLEWLPGRFLLIDYCKTLLIAFEKLQLHCLLSAVLE